MSALAGTLGFAAPALLGALVLLPALWLILRALPPAPLRRRFPAVTLLLGLEDHEHRAARTPLWLLLLRMAALAALIVGLAGPVLAPEARGPGRGPLLVLIDAGWADAGQWQRRLTRARDAIRVAGRAGRPVAVLAATAPPPAGALRLRDAKAAEGALSRLEPKPWLPRAAPLLEAIGQLPEQLETLWLSGGVDWDGRTEVLAALEAKGRVRVVDSARAPVALRPVQRSGGALEVEIPGAGPAREMAVLARGAGPQGRDRVLARAGVTFAPGAISATARFDLPAELAGRIDRFTVDGVSSAAAVTLTGGALARRQVALVTAGGGGGARALLDPLTYPEKALAPDARLLRAGLSESLDAVPDAMVLADVGRIAPALKARLVDWVEEGGVLIRFAGPRLAASDVGRAGDDPLLPVRLRAGGRSVGGRMSWEEPRGLAPFPGDSPFAGLAVPDEVRVKAQVLAQPDPELAAHTIAALDDGTPLVTRKALGEGEVVLFHVTANAEWSSLPLSGLFVGMMERLVRRGRSAETAPAALEGVSFRAERLMDGFGALTPADEGIAVDGARLAAATRPGPDLPPGIYGAEGQVFPFNVLGPDRRLAAAEWPARIATEALSAPGPRRLGGPVLAAALVLFMADLLASLALGGRLGLRRRAGAVPVAALLLALIPVLSGGPARAQAPEQLSEAEARAVEATRQITLAHVTTGEPQVDRYARAGLRGLSRVLARRTSVEPGPPMAVDPATDALAFFPLLYWPVTAGQPLPGADALARLNHYLENGGTILFDTRDADLAGVGAGTPAGQQLRRITAGLNIPPLEPVPDDHVLTRTFYLMGSFPGRHDGALWIEAAPAEPEPAPGVPFRRRGDGVTPVLIGGNDWAAAWAIDESGAPLVAMGGAFDTSRRREMAYRFGVNLAMYVLTGNYKSDQVHVPALLERLGQ